MSPGDPGARRGWWGLSCWNALSFEQQTQLIERGTLQIFSRAEGGDCKDGAQVAIETMTDEAPGPRFYCLGCAISYLQNMPVINA